MRAAILLWTPDAERPLLGLALGERALLAAAHAGIDRVAIVGDPHPERRARADGRRWPAIVELSALRDAPGAFVLPADLVFDRALLADPSALPEGPLWWLPPPELRALIDDPEAWAAGWLERAGDRIVDLGPGYCLRARDPAALRRARRALLRSLRKPIDGFISRHLNRHVSTFISGYLAPTGVHPNLLTGLFMLIGLASGWLAAQGQPWWILALAAACFQAQSILDGCDGEIARLTYRFSHLGQWLDSIGDDLTNYAFCLGLAIGQARVRQADWLYVAGFTILGLQLLVSGICYRRLILLGTGDLLAIPDLTTTGASGALGRLVEIGRVLTKRDVFVFVIALVTALGAPLLAFCLFAGGTVPTAVGVLLNDWKIAQRERTRGAG